MVAPDYATVAATIASSRASKAEAVRASATALDRLHRPGGEESDTPSLDPVPQELAAIIEARFTAGGVSLTARP